MINQTMTMIQTFHLNFVFYHHFMVMVGLESFGTTCLMIQSLGDSSSQVVKLQAMN